MSLFAMADNGQDIPVVRDAVMYDSFSGNKDVVFKGVGNELACTVSNLLVTLQSGEALIQGRHVTCTGTETLQLGANSNGFIVLRYDLTQVSNIVTLQAVPLVIKNDLNNGGTVRDIPLYAYSSSGTSATLSQDLRPISSSVSFSVENGEVYVTYTYNGTETKKRLGSLDPSTLTATPQYVLNGLTFGGSGSEEPQTGTMPNRGAVSTTITPSSLQQTYAIKKGYHNGSGNVSIKPCYSQHRQIFALNSSSETLDIDLGGYYTLLRVSVHIGGYRNTDQSANGTVTVTHGASAYTENTLGSTAISMGTSVTGDFDQIVYYPEVSTRYIRATRTGGRWNDALSIAVLYA